MIDGSTAHISAKREPLGVGAQFFEIVSEIKVLVKTRRQKKRPSAAGREMSNGR